jgi:hypothetical protein
LSPFSSEDLASRYGEAQKAFVRSVCGDAEVPMELLVEAGPAADP